MQDDRMGADPGQVGVPTHFLTGRTAVLADVADLATGRVDDARLGETLAACLLLDWPSTAGSATGGRQEGAAVPSVDPPSLAILAPFYAPQPVGSVGAPVEAWNDRLRRTPLLPESAWPALLAADRPQPVLQSALRRLRIAGLEPVPRDAARIAAGLPAGAGTHLSAALLCRLSARDRVALLRQICPDPDLANGTRAEVDSRPIEQATEGDLHA
jgi:hypothetical protein